MNICQVHSFSTFVDILNPLNPVLLFIALFFYMLFCNTKVVQSGFHCSVDHKYRLASYRAQIYFCFPCIYCILEKVHYCKKKRKKEKKTWNTAHCFFYLTKRVIVLIYLLFCANIFFSSSPNALTCNKKKSGLLLFTNIYLLCCTYYIVINVITIIMQFAVNGWFLSSLLVMVWLYYVPLVERMFITQELWCKKRKKWSIDLLLTW